MPSITQVFRSANALSGARRIRALHDMFDALLWTAFVQVYRGRISPPDGVQDWWSLPLEEWPAEKFETAYGIGDQQGRKDLLHDALDALLKKRDPVDVEQVYRILNKAKCDLAHWYETQNELDDQRVVEEERHRVETNLLRWTDRQQRLQRLEAETTTMSAQPIAKALHLKLPKKQTNAPSYRRPRSGPPIFDMRPTLKALAAARATGWIRTSLLEATGLAVLARRRTT